MAAPNLAQEIAGTTAPIDGPIGRGGFTMAPVAAAQMAVKPEFLRFPAPGKIEPYTGLRRSQLYELAADGLIETISLRRRGKVRGTRLIVADSLFGYLRGLIPEQNLPPGSTTLTE